MSRLKKFRNAVILAGGLAVAYYTGGVFGPDDVKGAFDSAVEQATSLINEYKDRTNR